MNNDSTPLLTRPVAHVALIELNRPTAANRIQPEDLQTLEQQLSECETNADIRSLVLTARGTHFSAGFDLRALSVNAKAGEGTQQPQPDSAFEQFANRLENTRLIVVAAINGPVVGGATDIALACDLRVGTDTTYMFMPAARIGLPLYAGALQRYVTRLGLNHAKRLVFLAQKIDAQEMLDIGFLNEITAQDALVARALALASDIASMPAEPLAAMKQTLNASALGVGNSQAQRDQLRAAFDGPRMARLIDEAQAARRT
jgi:enoyl-CoA hydratase